MSRTYLAAIAERSLVVVATMLWHYVLVSYSCFRDRLLLLPLLVALYGRNYFLDNTHYAYTHHTFQTFLQSLVLWRNKYLFTSHFNFGFGVRLIATFKLYEAYRCLRWPQSPLKMFKENSSEVKALLSKTFGLVRGLQSTYLNPHLHLTLRQNPLNRYQTAHRQRTTSVQRYHVVIANG